MIYSLIGELPRHLYCYVDTRYTHKQPRGFVPAVWYGLVSYPTRLWGCTVLLESGAVYRNVPAHALAFCNRPSASKWLPGDAQTWDCYGENFSTLEYTYLRSLECKVKANGKEYLGEYLFTVAPIGDGFSADPSQTKEFSFIHLSNGRLTIQPTNHVVFRERSFTDNKLEFPTDLRRQTEVYDAE